MMKFLNHKNNSNDSNQRRPSILNLFKRFKDIRKAAKSKNPVHISTGVAKHDDSDNDKDDDADDAMTESARIDKSLKDTSSQHFLKLRVAGLRRALKFPANIMTTGNEYRQYAMMRKPAKDIRHNDMAYFIGMIVAFVGIPLIMAIAHRGSATGRLAIGVVAAGVVWLINYFSVKSEFNNYRFHNQMRFQEFGSVLDLSELKRGYSINALLSEVAPRFKDQTLSNAISTLNSRIQDNPESPAPYLAFANEFSTTQRARLFMLSVYRMSQGHLDDSQIKDIKHSASKDLTYQSQVLMKKKEFRFHKLALMQFVGLVIHIIVYVLLFIGLDLYTSLKGVGM